MADANHSELPTRVAVGIIHTWRQLAFDQRLAAVGALLLIVSTFGPFSFVEGAILLTALGVLVLLHSRARGRAFHVPFGDGAVIAAAGGWSALLILVRLFNRPLGQGLLALVCAAILIAAGVRERGKHPAGEVEDRPATDSAPGGHADAAPSTTPDAAPPSTADIAPPPMPPRPADVEPPPTPPTRADAAPPAPTSPGAGAETQALPEPTSPHEQAIAAQRAPAEDQTTEPVARDQDEAETVDLRGTVRDPILAEDETEPIVSRLSDGGATPAPPRPPHLPRAADELGDSIGEPPEFVPPTRTSRWRRHRRR